MSALPPKADIPQHRLDVRFVPKADIGKGDRRMKRPRHLWRDQNVGREEGLGVAKIASF
jgi:hypothetical protein